MNISEYLIEFMNSLKIDTLFGISGAKIEHFFHSIYQSERPVSLVTAKHESAAAAMAAAYSKAGKCMGVVATTSGGAALNIVPSLGESYTENSSVLAIVGQAENDRELYGAFQETSGRNGTPHLYSILKNVSRYCKELNKPEDLPSVLTEVYELLVLNQNGPAVLIIPHNLFAKPITAPLSIFSKPYPITSTYLAKETSLPSGPFTIVAGRNVLKQKAVAEISSLAEKLNCPVVTTPDGKSAFDNFHPSYTGSIGIMGNPSAFESVKKAETLIVAGAILNETDLYGLKDEIGDKNILIIGETPLFQETYITISKSLVEGCQFLEQNLLPDRKKHTQKMTFSNKMNNPYVQMLKIIEKKIEPKTNVAIDAGVTGTYALHNLRVRSSNSFNIALGMAGMGYSFGSIIGAVKANKQRGILIAGDGSFYMNGFEIHTAIEMNLPILFIIFNNNSHKMCSFRESSIFNEQSGDNNFSPAYIGKGLAHMFPGLNSYDVATTEELEDAFQQTRNIDGPILISININNEERPPYLPLNQGA